MVQNMHRGVHSPSLGIFCAINQGPDTGVDHGPGAHRAGLDGHKHSAVCHAVIAEGRSGLAQGDDFGVGGGIGVGQVAVESTTDDLALMNNYGADRHFAYFERSLRSPQGLLHPQFVVIGASADQHEQYCMRTVARASALTQPAQLLRKWIDPSPV